MRGPKLNEGATAVGERHGTKATAKYVRASAYKARVVLDLIRGLPVVEADQVLQFTDRGIARDIRKVLASAVANATDVDSGAYIADADELFVLACFADEGPTLRRFRPRARGRATRIRKRTCHITVLVARMSEDRLEIAQARSEGRSSGQAANRRARVERSRQRAAEAKAGIDQVDSDEQVTDEIVDESVDAEAVEAEETDAGIAADAETADEAAADAETADEAAADAETAAEADADAGTATDEGTETVDETLATGDFAAGEYPGSVLPDAEGNGPDTHPIKGNADSMLYHTPDSRYYKVTKAEVWFDTEASAEAAGFSKPGANKDEDDS